MRPVANQDLYLYRVLFSEVGSAVRVHNSFFSFLLLQMLTSWIVGLPAVFWFHMNKGQYFKNWKKTCLTIINVGVFGCALAIVSFLHIQHSGSATN